MHSKKEQITSTLKVIARVLGPKVRSIKRYCNAEWHRKLNHLNKRQLVHESRMIFKRCTLRIIKKLFTKGILQQSREILLSAGKRVIQMNLRSAGYIQDLMTEYRLCAGM